MLLHSTSYSDDDIGIFIIFFSSSQTTNFHLFIVEVGKDSKENIGRYATANNRKTFFSFSEVMGLLHDMHGPNKMELLHGLFGLPVADADAARTLCWKRSNAVPGTGTQNLVEHNDKGLMVCLLPEKWRRNISAFNGSVAPVFGIKQKTVRHSGAKSCQNRLLSLSRQTMKPLISSHLVQIGTTWPNAKPGNLDNRRLGDATSCSVTTISCYNSIGRIASLVLLAGSSSITSSALYREKN